MPDAIDALIEQLLDWIGQGRVYDEVIAAWRTSCPRMPVWEEATERGLAVVADDPELGRVVLVSPAGAAFLAVRRATTA